MTFYTKIQIVVISKSAFFYSQFCREWEWPECEMCTFFYSAFIFRNGQNAIPSILQNEQNVANAFCINHSNSRIVNKKRTLRLMQKMDITSNFGTTVSYSFCLVLKVFALTNKCLCHLIFFINFDNDFQSLIDNVTCSEPVFILIAF